MSDLPKVSMGKFAIHSVDVRLADDGYCVSVETTMRVNDAVSPSRVVRTTRERLVAKQEIARHFDRALLHHIIRREVLKAAEHEVDEWLRINGELVTEPHR